MQRLHYVRKVVLLVSVATLFSGCVLMQRVTKDAKKQSLTVVAPMAEGTSCDITDSRGNKYFIEETPDVVVIRQGFSPLTFICKKEGYKTEITYLDDDRIAQSTMNLPDEMVGMVANPYARVATEFPREFAVWMQPLRWESKQHMRDWAFERSLYDHKLYLLEQKKLEAYRRMEEQRKFFKNWASNDFDKQQRMDAEKYFGASTGKLSHEENERRTKAFTEELDEFKDRFLEVMGQLLSGEAFQSDSSYKGSSFTYGTESGISPEGNVESMMDSSYPADGSARSKSKKSTYP